MNYSNFFHKESLFNDELSHGKETNDEMNFFSSSSFYLDQTSNIVEDNEDGDFLTGSQKDPETKSTITPSPIKNQKQRIFSYAKIPKISERMKQKIKKEKLICHNNNDKKIDGLDIDILNQRIHDGISLKDLKLTCNQKEYIKKEKNKISAQESRDFQKYRIMKLEESNRNLTLRLNRKDKENKHLYSIISSCSNCKEKIDNNLFKDKPFNIVQENNSFAGSQKINCISITGIIGLLSIIGLLITYNSKKLIETVRTLKESENERCALKTIEEVRYMQIALENSKYNFSPSNRDYLQSCDHLIRQQKENKFLKKIERQKKLFDETEKENIICPEYINAKIHNALNFEVFYNKKLNISSSFQVKITVPSLKYQDKHVSYITPLNNTDYADKIEKEKSNSSYHVVIFTLDSIHKIYGPDHPLNHTKKHSE